MQSDCKCKSIFLIKYLDLVSNNEIIPSKPSIELNSRTQPMRHLIPTYKVIIIQVQCLQKFARYYLPQIKSSAHFPFPLKILFFTNYLCSRFSNNMDIFSLSSSSLVSHQMLSILLARFFTFTPFFLIHIFTPGLSNSFLNDSPDLQPLALSLNTEPVFILLAYLFSCTIISNNSQYSQVKSKVLSLGIKSLSL